jgi:hypothetical protein
MRNSLMAVAAVVLLAGCGGEKTVYSDAEGNEVKVTREGDGDASEVKITSADGSATVNINAGATDAKLPFGLEVYPGAKVVSTMNSNSDGNTRHRRNEGWRLVHLAGCSRGCGIVDHANRRGKLSGQVRPLRQRFSLQRTIRPARGGGESRRACARLNTQ